MRWPRPSCAAVAARREKMGSRKRNDPLGKRAALGRDAEYPDVTKRQGERDLRRAFLMKGCTNQVTLRGFPSLEAVWVSCGHQFLGRYPSAAQRLFQSKTPDPFDRFIKNTAGPFKRCQVTQLMRWTRSG